MRWAKINLCEARVMHVCGRFLKLGSSLSELVRARVTVQTGASLSSFIRQQIIHLREKNIVYPTERSENVMAFSKLEERIYVFR